MGVFMLQYSMVFGIIIVHKNINEFVGNSIGLLVEASSLFLLSILYLIDKHFARKVTFTENATNIVPSTLIKAW